MKNRDFDDAFQTLTGCPPFPWQRCLFTDWFISHEKPLGQNIPPVADLPTGMGKTSVVAVWLLALMNQPNKIPRRLVYVVNRRTVVDQTTAEVERLRENLPKLRHANFQTLAISTLRGQFADNAEWSRDPSRPAVICGTVDMIGSRLVFEGYRLGFRSRPLHAGFLGQDALLVHDEAHLEPAFQALIQTIQYEQAKERRRSSGLPWPGLQVMALSATARSATANPQADRGKPFELTDEEKQPPEVIPDPPTEPIHHVWRRLKAKKSLQLHGVADEKKLPEHVAQLALQHKDTGGAVLVFMRTVDDVKTVRNRLVKDGVPDDCVRQLTGTMRGYERDKLVNDATFQRFFGPPKDSDGTVYLICTSAGEVGVNISADHIACDLSTFDSMAQRLGRVNRFGDRLHTRVDVVYPTEFDDKHKLTPARMATLNLLKELNGDASPKALAELPEKQRIEAFAPEPTILTATDILFDAWALTSIRQQMPGRPPVAPYLHGIAEWEPPRTAVGWRDEVQYINQDVVDREGNRFCQELLADYPLKPHELLSVRTSRVYDMLRAFIAEPKKSVKGDKRKAALKRVRSNAEAQIWLIDDSGSVTATKLGQLLKDDKKRAIDRLCDGVLLLPPCIGGLTAQGTLDGAAEHDTNHPQGYDVADQWLDEHNVPRRHRVFSELPRPENEPPEMALIRTVDIAPLADELMPPSEGGLRSEPRLVSEATYNGKRRRGRFWYWYARPRDAEDATTASARPIAWQHHTMDVVRRAQQIVNDLNLPDELKQAVMTAARFHDMGKQREIWQRSIGNPTPTNWYAKPGKPANGPRWRPRHLTGYRHEFGSVLDVLYAEGEQTSKILELTEETRDLVLHLIAAHHGYARPHFPPEAYDYEAYNTRENRHAAYEVMRRYARLQRRFGRWGLAYLESLLRAADWDASANPSDPNLEAGDVS